MKIHLKILLVSGTLATALLLSCDPFRVKFDELEEAVRRLALRMAAVPYEVSALNKKAANRVLEEMGLKTVIASGAELDAVSHFTPPVIEFWEIVNRDGIKAAIAWRDRKFKKLDEDE